MALFQRFMSNYFLLHIMSVLHMTILAMHATMLQHLLMLKHIPSVVRNRNFPKTTQLGVQDGSGSKRNRKASDSHISLSWPCHKGEMKVHSSKHIINLDQVWPKLFDIGQLKKVLISKKE